MPQISFRAIAGTALALAFVMGTALVPSRATAEPTRRMTVPPDTSLTQVRAFVSARALHSRVPASLLRGGPGVQRLLRERLAHDPKYRSEDLPAVLDALLAGEGRLPIEASIAPGACAHCPAGAAAMALDALAAGAPALSRGPRGLRLEIRNLTWSYRTATRAVGTRASERISGTQPVPNPEYTRLQTELQIALANRQDAEENDRKENGFWSGLRAMMDRSIVRACERSLNATSPLVDAPIHERYAIELTRAESHATLSAIVALLDPRTGHVEMLPVEASLDRRADGVRGVRPGDASGASDLDAEELLPDERDQFAAALDTLHASVATPVRIAAGRAALRRAAFENRRGRGAEALGWLLLARDCGADPPESAGVDAVLRRLARTPLSQLAQLRPKPFALPPGD